MHERIKLRVVPKLDRSVHYADYQPTTVQYINFWMILPQQQNPNRPQNITVPQPKQMQTALARMNEVSFAVFFKHVPFPQRHKMSDSQPGFSLGSSFRLDQDNSVSRRRTAAEDVNMIRCMFWRSRRRAALLRIDTLSESRAAPLANFY